MMLVSGSHEFGSVRSEVWLFSNLSLLKFYLPDEDGSPGSLCLCSSRKFQRRRGRKQKTKRELVGGTGRGGERTAGLDLAKGGVPIG